ncbi:unnamed protein product [Caenorhabditis auriculariae]|uniref:Uncharacterized protein n=1 Tax=Caenorhabditis auriculariae TaxID=2777116 RepID=A0A8S1HBU3_9PELO|nr:unnamed protein product [Caenorhabditis auriculariae]
MFGSKKIFYSYHVASGQSTNDEQAEFRSQEEHLQRGVESLKGIVDERRNKRNSTLKKNLYSNRAALGGSRPYGGP